MADTKLKILRSICANTREETETAAENFKNTDPEILELGGVAQKFLNQVVIAYQTGGPPTTKMIQDIALLTGEQELSLFTDEVAAEKAEWGTNYIAFVQQYVESLGIESLGEVCTEAMQIAREGREVRGEEEKGLKDAIQHVTSGATNIHKQIDPRQRAMANVDAVEFLRKEYETRRDSPMMAYGVSTGIRPLDEATKGGQVGELWIIGGFTSHGKTTWLLSWVRHAAIECGFNVMVFSLEMTKQQVWRILACGHSAHPKFDREPLDYEKMKSGTLSAEDERYYLDTLLPDLKSPLYGRIEVETPVGETNLADVRARAEALNRMYPLDMIAIDYVGLLGASKKSVRADKRQILNDNLAGSKQMALEFDHGHGVLVATPHQLNRQGNKKAQENNGVYEIEALSDANEAERSSDVIVTIYHDTPLRQKKEGVCTHLKNRDGAIVEPWNVYFPPEHRFIADLQTGTKQLDLEQLLKG